MHLFFSNCKLFKLCKGHIAIIRLIIRAWF
nr:MAG TPA: hypothetical protein [Crassvirales sp.]